MPDLPRRDIEHALAQRRWLSLFFLLVVVAVHHARPFGRDLRAEQQHAGRQVDEEQQRDRRAQRAVDGVVVGEVAQIEREPVFERLEQQRPDQRPGDDVPHARGHAGHDLVDDRERRPGQQERDQHREHAEETARLGPERSQRVGDGIRHVPADLEHGGRRDRDRQQSADAQHQTQINQLAAHERSAELHVPGGVEAEAQRRHHARRRPDQSDHGDHPHRRAAAGDRFDQRLQILPPRARRQQIEQLIDHALAQRVVGQQHAHHRDGQNRQREEREEHVVRHRGGELGAVVVEELGDRAFGQQFEVGAPPAQMQHQPATPARPALSQRIEINRRQPSHMAIIRLRRPIWAWRAVIR